MELSSEWLQLAPLLYSHLSSTPTSHPTIQTAAFLQHRPIKQSFKYRTLELLLGSTTSANNGNLAICYAELPLTTQLEDDRIKCRISSKIDLMFQSPLSAVEQVEISPESMFLAAAEQEKKSVVIYSVEALTTIKDKSQSTKPRTSVTSESPVTRIASRKEELLVGQSSGSIELFNLNRSSSDSQKYNYHRQPIIDLCWLTKNQKEREEERFFASASTEEWLYIWDRRMPAPGSKIEHLQQGVTSLAAVKSNAFISGGRDHTIKYWDLRNTNNQCECYIFKDHTASVSTLRSLEDCQSDKVNFISGANNGEVMIWEQEVEFLHGGHRSKVVALDYHRDIRMLLSVEESTNAVQLWQPVSFRGDK